MQALIGELAGLPTPRGSSGVEWDDETDYGVSWDSRRLPRRVVDRQAIAAGQEPGNVSGKAVRIDSETGSPKP